MIRIVNNNIGLLFFVKDNYLKYSLKDKVITKGDKKVFEQRMVESHGSLESDILWITNIESIPDYFPENIKNFNFFNVGLKSIIQYYNIEKSSTKIQFNKLIGFYQKLFYYFKEEYPNLSISVEKLKKLDNFFEIFERSEIKNNINIDFPWNFVDDVNLEFNTKDNVDYNFHGYFSYSKLLEILSVIKFPTGGLEIYDVDKEKRIDKISFSKMSDNKDFAIIGKVIPAKNNTNKVIDEISAFESEHEKIITDFEIEYLLSVFDIQPSKFIFFNETHTLKELIRLPFRLSKYNSFSYDIFCKNILLSIKNNDISILNFWVSRFERLYKLDKLMIFNQNNINIAKNEAFEFKLSIEDDAEVEVKSNKNNIPFTMKQIKKPINVSLLEGHNFCYLYKDYLDLKNKKIIEEK